MRIERAENKLTIFLKGDIDATNAPKLQEEIMSEIENANNISLTFDAKKLTYISSAGLRLIISTQKKLKNKICITNISKNVMQIFAMVNFDQLVNLSQKETAN